MTKQNEETTIPEITDDIYDISEAEETKKWAWLSNIHPLMAVTGCYLFKVHQDLLQL